MGQNLTKVITVSSGSISDNADRNYLSLQDAVDNASPGYTIIVDGGDHYLCNIKSSIHIVGLNGAKILTSKLCKSNDVTFENIIFENIENGSIIFEDCRGYVFRNCEFYITLASCDQKCVFGLQFISGSALFQNPIFCIDVENIKIFVIIGASCGSGYISLQSPIIRVTYKDVDKIDTYFFRGSPDDRSLPYIESFSASIQFKHKNQRRRKHKIHNTKIRLFRGLDCVNSFMNNTRVHFINGCGVFNIAAGDSYIYINGLTASTDNSHYWKIGLFDNILLTSFQSNLECACDIDELTCVEPKKYDLFKVCRSCSVNPCRCITKETLSGDASVLPTPLPEKLQSV